MGEIGIKKIVYLFGAGATHAEVMNIGDKSDGNFEESNGVLISHVSKRVMRKVQDDLEFKKNINNVTSEKGEINIELLISLIGSNQIENVDDKVNKLEKLVREDITGILTTRKRKEFYFHKALVELHKKTRDREEFYAAISLNYDSVLDDAFAANQITPNYCISPETVKGTRLLKLHGSFKPIVVPDGHIKKIPIIPLGINKNYLVPPYSLIWSNAFDALTKCDILRVIGCSMSPNDLGLIDLLFKAQLSRSNALEIQIIDFEPVGETIKRNYGFFSKIKSAREIERRLMNDLEDSPFKVWLKAKSLRALKSVKEIKKTDYIAMLEF